MDNTTIEAGFKFFNLKNLKGKPAINSREDYNDMLNMWADSLQDVQDIVFITACKMLSDELTFYPSFAEVRKKCDDLLVGKKEVAAEVWKKYRKSMMAVNCQYSNPGDKEKLFNSIKCEVTKEACGLFYWRVYGQSNEDQVLYFAREFEKIYNSVKERHNFKKAADRALIGTGKTSSDLLSHNVNNLIKKIGTK